MRVALESLQQWGLLHYLAAVWTVPTASDKQDRAPDLICGSSRVESQLKEEPFNTYADCAVYRHVDRAVSIIKVCHTLPGYRLSTSGPQWLLWGPEFKHHAVGNLSSTAINLSGPVFGEGSQALWGSDYQLASHWKLFVCFGVHHKGIPLSKDRLAHWLKELMAQA